MMCRSSQIVLQSSTTPKATCVVLQDDTVFWSKTGPEAAGHMLLTALLPFLVLGFDRIPWWVTLLISVACAFLTAIVVWFSVCPHLRKKIANNIKSSPFEHPLMQKNILNAVPDEPLITTSWVSPVQLPPSKITFDIGETEDMNDKISKDLDDTDLNVCSKDQVQFSNSNELSNNGYSHYHTTHKDSGLYKDLLHKLHLAKVGDCMGEGDRTIRRNNSYTSYTMAICGMHNDFKQKDGDVKPADDGDKEKKQISTNNYTGYFSTVTESRPPDHLGEVVLDASQEASSEKSLEEDALEIDRPEVSLLFQFLQILTACFGSFAHGGNDVSCRIQLALRRPPSSALSIPVQPSPVQSSPVQSSPVQSRPVQPSPVLVLRVQ